ncbi:MAG: hypothetical protein Kow0075_03930 [Salibacteraceae bacterium]
MKINWIIRNAIAATTALVLTGCVTIRVAMNESANTGAAPEVYFSKLPNRPYVEVAYLQADGAVFHTPRHLLNGLKKKAAEIGADAIVDVRYDFQAWYPVAMGVAIKYK